MIRRYGVCASARMISYPCSGCCGFSRETFCEINLSWDRGRQRRCCAEQTCISCCALQDCCAQRPHPSRPLGRSLIVVAEMSMSTHFNEAFFQIRSSGIKKKWPKWLNCTENTHRSDVCVQKTHTASTKFENNGQLSRSQPPPDATAWIHHRWVLYHKIHKWIRPTSLLPNQPTNQPTNGTLTWP